MLNNNTILRNNNNGFTLIEISMTLIIIGLIAGGILMGKDLIRAAEIRSVIKDIDTYKTAFNTFRLKYNCIAGDCPNATDFWGARNANNTTCLTITPTIATPTLTCNGNNNAKVEDGTEEPFLFWQHLANAGIIQGQYTGIHDGAVIFHHVLGQNAPNAAISRSGFGFSYLNAISGDGGTYAINYGNLLWLGNESVHRPQIGIFIPSEAFSVDQKIDDGKPATGFIIMRSNYIDASSIWGSANACTTSTGSTDYTGIYNVTVTVPSCAFMIKTGY